MTFEKILSSTDDAKTDWESLAEMADSEELRFNNARETGERKMAELENKFADSSFVISFRGFAKNCHEKSADCINAAAERMAQLAEGDDDEISVIMHSRRAGISGGRWYSNGELGTGEYIFETLGSKCSPANIGRLETIARTIPSSDYVRFENMRMDAYRIENIVIAGRSFIHDCAPEAHRLIEAMIDYYDARESDEVDEKRENLSRLLSELREKHGAGYTDPHEKYIFDLDNYDKTAGAFSGDPVGGLLRKDPEANAIYDGDKGDVRAIDVLRRLKEDMEPVPLEAPKTKISELNEAFERLGQVSVNEETGELRIEVDDLAEVLGAINRHLMSVQGQRELFPSTIQAVAYTDRLSAAALRNISKKDWREIAFDPVFKEIVRFAQLTMSGGYSEDEFEGIYARFMAKAGEAFGEDSIDDEKAADAFEIIQSRTLDNSRTVASEFSDNPYLGYLSAAVWSGNLTHELIGLKEKYSS